VFRLLLVFWRCDGRLPDEPEAPGEIREQAPETFRPDDHGQSIVEYAIILTWLTLFFIGLIGAVSGSTKQVWVAANSNLSHANAIAAGS
jgi:Flp pilus assembly pilin Flp